MWGILFQKLLRFRLKYNAINYMCNNVALYTHLSKDISVFGIYLGRIPQTENEKIFGIGDLDKLL
jgi:hypothetical protein